MARPIRVHAASQERLSDAGPYVPHFQGQCLFAQTILKVFVLVQVLALLPGKMMLLIRACGETPHI